MLSQERHGGERNEVAIIKSYLLNEDFIFLEPKKIVAHQVVAKENNFLTFLKINGGGERRDRSAVLETCLACSSTSFFS